MLDIHRLDASPSPKTYFTHSIIPSYLDPLNLSTKKHPFATINAQPFTHTLDLLLPAELYALVRSKLASTYYARAHLKLSDILAPDFLSTYIKGGNIAMLSEGRPLVDNCFSLHAGTLRMELDRQTYERCGLAGVPIEDGGRKHQRARWVVTCDLRAPAMTHGKKGFARLEWAAKNVLDRSLTWVFWNAMPGSKEALEEGKEVLSRFQPWVKGVEGETVELGGRVYPRLKRGGLEDVYDEVDAMGLLEYLDFLALDSPRLMEGDEIDAHLSRYEVPDFGAGVGVGDFVRVRWKGFITPSFIRDLFVAVVKVCFKSKARGDDARDVDMDTNDESAKEEAWFAMSAQAFGGKSKWTVMQFEGRETLTWHVES
jgi:ribonuclease P/MRP protein subunit RPP40